MSQRKDLAEALAALHDRSDDAAGPRYWRSLEELADTPAFQELMRNEFPEQATVWPEALSRRQFLTLMGASLALADLGGCSVRPAPSGTVVPYVRTPEEIVPGRPLFYATAMTLGGAGVGLLVESHLGRPTKVEGNLDHPASRGATSLLHQASVLTLYDPDRAQDVTHLGQTSTWDDALTVLRPALERLRPRRGAGLRILTETVVSPTLAGQIRALLGSFGEASEARWHQYEPLGRDSAFWAARQAFGAPVDVHHDFREADVVLALDADFLNSGPAHLRYTADFMARRRVRTTALNAGQARMNRLYVVETAITGTGVKADHRLALRAAEIAGFARALAARLGVVDGGSAIDPPAALQRWVNAVAGDLDLDRHRGRSVVIVGDRQPAAVHLLAHQLNRRLDNFGRTVIATAPVAAQPVDQAASLRELVDAMSAGSVEVLLVLGGNPVFTAPADLHFSESMQHVPLRVHLGLYRDETARQCHWHLPETHYLEAWSDTRAFDGTASIVQPLIQPLYRGRSAHELLDALTGHQGRPGLEIVRDHWRRHWEQHGRSGTFEHFWQTSVHDGVVDGTRLPAYPLRWQDDWQRHLPPAAAAPSGIELVFQADPTIYDGRFANNGWLQECPKPITTLTWDNAAIMSPRTARDLGVGLGSYAHGGEHGGYHPDVVALTVGERTVEAPVWVMPGHADGAVTVYLGYGRDQAGRVGGTAARRVGFNAYALRTAAQPSFAAGLTVRRTGRRQLVACTQQHHLMENRAPVRSASLAQYQQTPRFAHEEEEQLHRERAQGIRQPLTMYDPREHEHPGHKWGMAIDLTACTGCHACVVACQAENNIPVVGKDQVSRGREMHWLRIDRYVSGSAEAPRAFHFQPVPCMHCENAPCEYVCPVEATVHSADGLNDMIYQRCVGTRFCSNNCPYKVRRFNFFHYADFITPSVRQQYNPDVTVRSRGVMEKCSYCVQRIRQADIDAQVGHRAIADGEVLTACQAACPAKAIAFGDLNDRGSEVSRWKATPLNYGLLADLNTHPRTTYLAALRNPNSELEAD